MSAGGAKSWDELKTKGWDFSRFSSDFYLRGGEVMMYRHRLMRAEAAPMAMAKGMDTRARNGAVMEMAGKEWCGNGNGGRGR